MSSTRDGTLAVTAFLVWALFVGLVYLPDVGRGFLKDDFRWVADAREAASRPLSAFTNNAAGTFYRPVVMLSFIAEHGRHQLEPRGYGLTNLLLYAACALAATALFRLLGLKLGAAALGAFAWAMNPEGINMALLWISGRTSLLMTLSSLAAVIAFLIGTRTASMLLLACALFSKEDALGVPVVMFAAKWLTRHVSRREALLDTVAVAAVLTVYFALRTRSGALTPTTAPAFYQLSLDPLVLLVNMLHYLERSGAPAAVLSLIGLALYRARPGFGVMHRRLLVLALVWFAAGIAIAVGIPVRSSLYIVFPSIAGALTCSLVFDALQSTSASQRGSRAMQVALVAMLLLVPVYRARDLRWTAAADVSRQVTEALTVDGPALPDHGVVVFEDSAARFANFADALGGAATEAVRLYSGRQLTGRILPPGEEAPQPDEVARYRLKEGRVVR